MIELVIILGILCAVLGAVAVWTARDVEALTEELNDARSAASAAYREVVVMRDALANLQQEVRQERANRHRRYSEAVRKGNATRKAKKAALTEAA